MKKKCTAIIFLLYFTCLLGDLVAEPGINGTSQFRRRNYYVDMYSDTWRANASFGGEMYFGEDDLLYLRSKRIAPSFSLSLQKEVSSLFGMRLKYNFTGHKNFYSLTTIIPFYSMGLSADFMVNATKIIVPYSEGNPPKIWLFAGMGGEYSFEQALHKKYEVKDRISPTYNMGSLAEIYLNDNIDLTFELRGVIVKESFDGQIKGIATEGYATFLVGVNYRFY